MSSKAKNIIVGFLLLFLYPIGVIAMLIWREKWYLWVRFILFLPLILAILGVIYVGIIFGMNRNKVPQVKQNSQDFFQCVYACDKYAGQAKIDCQKGCQSN